MIAYSFIILTYNEEEHLPRLLASIKDLQAPVFILDSGSEDNTLIIARDAGASILQHPFENHPKQWDFALKNFDIQTPWVICLDADQEVTPQLRQKLQGFKDEDYIGIDGIYFNRKNYFKGQWIKRGGYYPFYLLKMIRYGRGYSDLNENMDHRFIVPGQTEVWKDGHILEENLKENKISFWIAKHNRYSDLLASEEVERMQNLRQQTLKPNLFGSPDERTAWLKKRWWQLPRYVRPLLYFSYRMIFQLGILEGRTGIIFHFLQGFWFRLIVDVKIEELIKGQQKKEDIKTGNEHSPLKFAFRFLFLFVIFYYFNILFFGITSPGNHYSPFLADNLNYISSLRRFILSSSAQILNWMGFATIHNETSLLVAGKGSIEVIYSCLGLGLMSFFAAFVISYPGSLKPKIIFLISGILIIQVLNITRFVLLALFWNKRANQILDHHTIFNLCIYIFVIISLYFWVTKKDQAQSL